MLAVFRLPDLSSLVFRFENRCIKNGNSSDAYACYGPTREQDEQRGAHLLFRRGSPGRSVFAFMQARTAISSLPLAIVLASLQLPKEVLRPLDGATYLALGDGIRRLHPDMFDDGERTLRVVEEDPCQSEESKFVTILRLTAVNT